MTQCWIAPNYSPSLSMTIIFRNSIRCYFHYQCQRLWRRTCSPGDPTPQRQCAWLLYIYLKKGEEQKDVLEAKDDEEKESEVDGEVEERERERESLNVRMRHGDDRGMDLESNSSLGVLLSQSVMRKESD